MSDLDLSSFPLVAKGNKFEDFSAGQVLTHHWGRTITAGDNAIFSTAMCNWNPMHLNAEFARAHGHPDVVVNPMLVPVHRRGHVGRGPQRGRRSLPGRRGLHVPPAGASGRHASPPAPPWSTPVPRRAARASASSPGTPRPTTSAASWSSTTGARTSSPSGSGHDRSAASRPSPATDNFFEDFPVGRRLRHARRCHRRRRREQPRHQAGHEHRAGPLERARHGRQPDGRRSPGLRARHRVAGVRAGQPGHGRERALAELGCTGLRFKAPVHLGDTLYAYTEVLAADPSPDRDDAGVVRFKHWGVTHDDRVVFEGERIVLVKRRSHWAEEAP